jgi:hypothetical protein
MGTLRRIFQFLFGLEALSLVVTLAATLFSFRTIYRAFQAAPAHPSAHHRAQSMVLALAVSWILELAPAIAWWKLRKAQPAARWWALVSSVLCLPVPLHGTLGLAWWLSHFWARFIATPLHLPTWLVQLAFGLAGIAAFLWRRPIQAETSKKPERVAGDGTSGYIGYVLQGVAGAGLLFALALWSRWGGSHGLKEPGPSLRWAALIVALVIEISGHEFGHFLAGSLAGHKLRGFHVGPLLWSIRNGRWRLDWNLRDCLNGSVGMVPLTLDRYRERTMLLLAGGPLGSLTMSTVSLALLLSLKPSAPWAWFLLARVASISAFSFCLNLIPQRTRFFYSDGAQLYQLFVSGPWRKVHIALAMASLSVLSPLGPRDWDIATIEEAAAFLQSGMQGMLLRLLAAYYYLDAGCIDEALARLHEAEALFSPDMPVKPADFYAEFTFLNALYARDPARAEAWWLKLRALSKIDRDADYWRAGSAYLWLNGDLEGARQAWEQGNEKAQKLPSSGIYDFTRRHFAELRKAIDNGAPVSSDMVNTATPVQAA